MRGSLVAAATIAVALLCPTAQATQERVPIEHLGTHQGYRSLQGGDLLTFAPVEEHTATVILCHGLGDSAQGWSDSIRFFFSYALPWVKFVLPTAPKVAVTMNGGVEMNSWFDIAGLRDSSRNDETCPGIVQSQNRLLGLIAAEIAAGIPAERIVLVGFSQGGALSLFTGLQYPGRLGGVVSLSGWLPCPADVTTADGALQTPVLMLHGGADTLVLPSWSDDAQQWLQANGIVHVDRVVYNGLEHTTSQQMLGDTTQWIQKNVPGPKA